MIRSNSISDTGEAYRDALCSIRTLEAEIILLPNITDESRNKLLDLIANVKHETVTSINHLLTQLRQPLTRKANIHSSSSSRLLSSSPPNSNLNALKGANNDLQRVRSTSSVTPPRGSGASSVPRSSEASSVPRSSGTAAPLSNSSRSAGGVTVTLPPPNHLAAVSASNATQQPQQQPHHNNNNNPHHAPQVVSITSQASLALTSADRTPTLETIASFGMLEGGPRTTAGQITASSSAMQQQESMTSPLDAGSYMPAVLSSPNSAGNPLSIIDPVSFLNRVALEKTSLAQQGGATSSIGHCLTATLYMMLEALVVACEADRGSLYAPSRAGGPLYLAAYAGLGMPVAKKLVPANAGGILMSVFQTGIAANLDGVGYEEVAECPGPTNAKNAIAFPVVACLNSTSVHQVVGVVMLVNKQRGTRAFDSNDESLLHQRLPLLAYCLKRYPFDAANYPFDPSPLHRHTPLIQWTPNLFQLPSSLSTAPYVQRVYHRNAGDRTVRRDASIEGTSVVSAESPAEAVMSCEAYMSVLEECWKRGINDRVEVELSLRQKLQHLADAREILLRKQRKFDVLKEALCEQLEKSTAMETERTMSRRKSSVVALPDGLGSPRQGMGFSPKPPEKQRSQRNM